MKYAKVYLEDVEIGAEMPPLVKGPIEQIQLTRYAGASGDFNPIHQDAAFAKAAGMGDVFGHGMLSMGFVAQSVTDWLGVGTPTFCTVPRQDRGQAARQGAGRWGRPGGSGAVGREPEGREGRDRPRHRGTDLERRPVGG